MKITNSSLSLPIRTLTSSVSVLSAPLKEVRRSSFCSASASSHPYSDRLFFSPPLTSSAHGPRGTEAVHSVHVYRFHPSDGSLCLLNIAGDAKTVINPAFSRYHPRLNVVYTCTEDCHENGKIFAYKIGPDGSLEQFGEPVDAGGTSTCYLTIDRAQKNMLAVNYWDSTLVVIPLDPETGAMLGSIKNTYDPKQGKKMVACAKKDGGVNHSCNDDTTISVRQADPHSHALVLDPFVGRVAYVPDLGKDLIREFYYDATDGAISLELNVMPSGLCTGKPDGPRYFEFHPQYNIAYVVNELSSTIAVFEVDRALLNEIHAASKAGEDMTRFKGRSTLRLVQSISTIPSAFPTTMNTCGRICVHKSGRFVVVSNRGHQSITVFKVKSKGSKRGELQNVGCFHTRGETPRHFQFDHSGQYLLVANQDTNSIAVFNFNLSNGELKYSGNEYRVPSPNFVCCCPTYHDDDDTRHASTPDLFASMTVTTNNNKVLGAYDESGSDSEDSTVPTYQNDPADASLKEELAKAKQEIEALKKLLAEKA
jgi:6-phosphogluconolactonase